MNLIDQLFNFVECCEHTLVNLYPYLALMFTKMGIMTALLHAVYCGNDFSAQLLPPYNKSRRRFTTAKHLVAPTPPAPCPPTRKSSPAPRTTANTTGFLGTSLINLKRSTLNV